MPEITIGDVPQDELDALESRGRRHGRSADEEIRHILHEAAAEEMLVLELERATRAAEETLRAVKQPAQKTPASINAPRRRSRTFEPTPRRR